MSPPEIALYHLNSLDVSRFDAETVADPPVPACPVRNATHITSDVDDVTCENCLCAAIKNAGNPIAVQAYVLRLGELSLQKRHPSIYAELEGLGQVSKINKEIREALAEFGNDRQDLQEPLRVGDVLQVGLGDTAVPRKVTHVQPVGDGTYSIETEPMVLREETRARLVGYVFAHGKETGDFDGRECSLQRGGGWAIIREASAVGLMAKGFCALDHKIPEEKIRELGGYVDPPADPTKDLKCTCGAVEVSEVAQHLRPCPLSFERGDCPRCGRPIVLASFTELGFYEPDVDVNNDPVVWRHAYSGYGACGDMGGFASDPNPPENTWETIDGLTGPLPPEPEPKYGHDREGFECAPEICGGTRLDPCTYSPADIRRFEAEEDEERRGGWTREVTRQYWPGEDHPKTFVGEAFVLDPQGGDGRGTASTPVIVMGPPGDDERATRVRYETLDHAHNGNGVCVKNRFGDRCLADPNATDADET